MPRQHFSLNKIANKRHNYDKLRKISKEDYEKSLKVFSVYLKLYLVIWLEMQPGERSIFERGCLRAGEEWLELNLVPVAGTIVSTMVLQVFYTPT